MEATRRKEALAFTPARSKREALGLPPRESRKEVISAPAMVGESTGKAVLRLARWVFDEADVDGSGTLDKEELVTLFKSLWQRLGSKPAAEMKLQLAQQVDQVTTTVSSRAHAAALTVLLGRRLAHSMRMVTVF